FVGLVQPGFPIPLLAPTGRGGLGDLLSGVYFQVIGWSDHPERGLVEISLPRDQVEEEWPFIPPVAKEFRIVRGDDDRRAIHNADGLPDLRDARIEKVLGVL